MARNTASTDGESNADHPAAGLDTIVVDPDDVIEAMRRNKRDEDEQRSHVLRVTPPLEGEQTATPHVSEAHTRYPSEMDPKPLHIAPEAFIVEHEAGSRHPDWSNEWAYPDYGTQKARFHDEFDARDEHGDIRQLTDDEEAEWEEWWDTVVETWKANVRHALGNTDELTLTSQHPDIDDTTVSVRVEEE